MSSRTSKHPKKAPTPVLRDADIWSSDEVRQAAKAEHKHTRQLGRRAGRAAFHGVLMTGIVASNPQVFFRNESADAQFEKGTGINRIGRMMIKAFDRSSAKQAEKMTQRSRVVEDARIKAVEMYRAAHPEIAERERREAAKKYRQDTLFDIHYRHQSAVDYFRNGSRHGDAFSFSKGIPRRPSHEGAAGFTGNYAELAKSTLQTAVASRNKDGLIPLLNGTVEARRFEQQAASLPLQNARQNAYNYTGGANTALWQLGFVEYADESDIPYGRGKFSPAVTWEASDKTVTARLPFDPTNELHQVLGPVVEGQGAGQMIEIEMPQKRYDRPEVPYMHMRVVPAEVLAPVPA